MTQAAVNVYKSDEDYVFVYSENLTKGTVLSETNKEKIYTLKNMSQIQGVYIVNRGYTVFCRHDTIVFFSLYHLNLFKNSITSVYNINALYLTHIL